MASDRHVEIRYALEGHEEETVRRRVRCVGSLLGLGLVLLVTSCATRPVAGRVVARTRTLGEAPRFVGEPGTRYALLIGVSGVGSSSCPVVDYAVEDVRDLARELDAAGYDEENVILLADGPRGTCERARPPSGEAIRESAAWCAEKLTEHDSLLVAYSGPGLSDRESPITLDELYTSLETVKARDKVLLLDARRAHCRAVTRPCEAPEEALDPPEGWTVALAAEPGTTSYEHPDLQHSVFFHAVLQSIRTGTRDAELTTILQEAGQTTQECALRCCGQQQIPVVMCVDSANWCPLKPRGRCVTPRAPTAVYVAGRRTLPPPLIAGPGGTPWRVVPGTRVSHSKPTISSPRTAVPPVVPLSRTRRVVQPAIAVPVTRTPVPTPEADAAAMDALLDD